MDAPDYNRVGIGIPKYQWAESILSLAKEQDVEPWVVIRRFPKVSPRKGWYAMSRYIKSHPEALRDEEVSYGRWQSNL